MQVEIITKEEVLYILKNYNDYGLLRRETAARYLDMPLSTFDAFVRDNPQLKKYNGKRVRYCPKELKAVFENVL